MSHSISFCPHIFSPKRSLRWVIGLVRGLQGLPTHQYLLLTETSPGFPVVALCHGEPEALDHLDLPFTREDFYDWHWNQDTDNILRCKGPTHRWPCLLSSSPASRHQATGNPFSIIQFCLLCYYINQLRLKRLSAESLRCIQVVMSITNLIFFLIAE